MGHTYTPYSSSSIYVVVKDGLFSGTLRPFRQARFLRDNTGPCIGVQLSDEDGEHAELMVVFRADYCIQMVGRHKISGAGIIRGLEFTASGRYGTSSPICVPVSHIRRPTLYIDIFFLFQHLPASNIRFVFLDATRTVSTRGGE